VVVQDTIGCPKLPGLSNKSININQVRYLAPRAKFERQFNEDPRVGEVLTDNLYRLTLLAGVERLLTLRQAYGGLKTRFTFGDSNTYFCKHIRIEHAFSRFSIKDFSRDISEEQY